MTIERQTKVSERGNAGDFEHSWLVVPSKI
ncbi:hypothetical protein CEXT_214181, partial [Caerostris extrusa]